MSGAALGQLLSPPPSGPVVGAVGLLSQCLGLSCCTNEKCRKQLIAVFYYKIIKFVLFAFANRSLFGL